MSMALNYHASSEDFQVIARQGINEPNDLWVTVGQYPAEVTLFLTLEQADELRHAISVALQEIDMAGEYEDEGQVITNG